MVGKNQSGLHGSFFIQNSCVPFSLFKHRWSYGYTNVHVDGVHEGLGYQHIDLMPIKQDKLIVKFFRMIGI